MENISKVDKAEIVLSGGCIECLALPEQNGVIVHTKQICVTRAVLRALNAEEDEEDVTDAGR